MSVCPRLKNEQNLLLEQSGSYFLQPLHRQYVGQKQIQDHHYPLLVGSRVYFLMQRVLAISQHYAQYLAESDSG